MMIHRYTTIGSTNARAFELGQQGAPHGEVVYATEQTAGRGRMGKSWISPAGKGLYFSILLRPKLMLSDFAKLSMTAGLAVAKVLESLGEYEVALKWPNDVYISAKKCCGILTEASFVSSSTESPFVVIGIGMNVLMEKSDFPVEMQTRVTSLLLETGTIYEFKKLFSQLYHQVLHEIEAHEKRSFSSILQQWKKRDLLLGRELEWLTGSRKIVKGISMGPDRNGQLRVRDRYGNIHYVISGDVSLAG